MVSPQHIWVLRNGISTLFAVRALSRIMLQETETNARYQNSFTVSDPRYPVHSNLFSQGRPVKSFVQSISQTSRIFTRFWLPLALVRAAFKFFLLCATRRKDTLHVILVFASGGDYLGTGVQSEGTINISRFSDCIPSWARLTCNFSRSYHFRAGVHANRNPPK